MCVITRKIAQIFQIKQRGKIFWKEKSNAKRLFTPNWFRQWTGSMSHEKKRVFFVLAAMIEYFGHHLVAAAAINQVAVA